MLWAASATGLGWSEGKVRGLTVPWPSLARFLRPMGGQQVMTIAAPGVGKSTFALNWAALSGARTFYASADTDQRLMTRQLAALATGHDQETVEERLRDSKVFRHEYAVAIRHAFPNLVMDFSRSPSMHDVVARGQALTEVWGDTPELIVLDTASNMRRKGDDYSAWRDLWLNIGELARYFNAVVMVAHHVRTGAAAAGTLAPSMDEGKYGAHEFCEIVLGMHRSGGGEITITALKNRGGRSNVNVRMRAEYEYARIREFTKEDVEERAQQVARVMAG